MIGPMIRAQRRSMGMTLEALAREAGCTKGYLSSIETGRRERPPSEAILGRIEGALRMEPGRLVLEGRLASTPEEVRGLLAALEGRVRSAARLAELVLHEGRDRGVWSEELERLASRLAVRDRGACGAEGDGGGLAAGVAPVINTVEEGYPVMPDGETVWRRSRGVVSAPVELGAGAFALRVVGDAMVPAYAEGDVVIVRPSEVRSGGDFFVRLYAGEETTFRRVFLERGADGVELARLQPANVARGARVVPAEAISGAWEAAYVFGWVGGGARALARGEVV